MSLKERLGRLASFPEKGIVDTVDQDDALEILRSFEKSEKWDSIYDLFALMTHEETTDPYIEKLEAIEKAVQDCQTRNVKIAPASLMKILKSSHLGENHE